LSTSSIEFGLEIDKDDADLDDVDEEEDNRRNTPGDSDEDDDADDDADEAVDIFRENNDPRDNTRPIVGGSFVGSDGALSM
jgi:hypothetical protein